MAIRGMQDIPRVAAPCPVSAPPMRDTGGLTAGMEIPCRQARKETAMAESIEEQVAYGRHCVHGTAVGTPGGADLMCGDCEMGYTEWVDAVFWQMTAVWRRGDSTLQFQPVKVGPLYEEATMGTALAHVLTYHHRYADNVLGPLGWTPEYRAVIAQTGFWATQQEAEVHRGN